jgi:hypothetical protein
MSCLSEKRPCRSLLLSAIAVVWGVAGCGEKIKGMPPLAPVRGTITLDGKPLAKTGVIFSSEKGHSSIGLTDELGRYELRFIRGIRGAVIGKHAVRLDGSAGLDQLPGPDFKNPVPAKFSKSSTLTADVAPGANKIDFELSTKD